MNYWNHVLWSDESKVNLFGSDGVQHVWALLTVKHGGGSIMVWGCLTTAGTWGAAVHRGKHGFQHVL